MDTLTTKEKPLTSAKIYKTTRKEAKILCAQMEMSMAKLFELAIENLKKEKQCRSESSGRRGEYTDG